MPCLCLTCTRTQDAIYTSVVHGMSNISLLGSKTHLRGNPAASKILLAICQSSSSCPSFHLAGGFPPQKAITFSHVWRFRIKNPSSQQITSLWLQLISLRLSQSTLSFSSCFLPQFLDSFWLWDSFIKLVKHSVCLHVSMLKVFQS